MNPLCHNSRIRTCATTFGPTLTRNNILRRYALIIDRVTEWDDPVRFAAEPTTSFRIGVVSGRRRQGKSFILDELARQVGGFYHQALEEERAPALQRLGAAMAADRGLPGGSLPFPDWSALLRTLAEQAPRLRQPRLRASW